MGKIIGITGGIASGKSTVVAEIRKAGYQVIDADQVVHELQAKGGRLYQALINWLGSDILDETGELNRPKLSQLLFGNPDYLAKSADIQGEIIREELATRRDILAANEALFFMDIPLLIEDDYQEWFDEIWLVYVTRSIQIDRLMIRNRYSQEEAELRISSQMPLDDKRDFADVIIDNTGTLEQLKQQVQEQLEAVAKG